MPSKRSWRPHPWAPDRDGKSDDALHAGPGVRQPRPVLAPLGRIPPPPLERWQLAPCSSPWPRRRKLLEECEQARFDARTWNGIARRGRIVKCRVRRIVRIRCSGIERLEN